MNPRGVVPHRLSRAKSSEEVAPNDRFINPATSTHYYWGAMAIPMLNVLRIKDSEGNIVVEVSSRRDIKLLGELLRSLGVAVAGGKRERFIEFNEMFMEY
ncbi:MAG: hypothetical protein QXJ64_10730, partial [Thermosphaera sp.]